MAKNNPKILSVLNTGHSVGPTIVDYENHLDPDFLDDESREGYSLFRSKIMENPRHDKMKPLDRYAGGITPKVFFRAGGERQGQKVLPSKTFMIKPYYEDMDGWDEAHMPIGGWAEMVWMRMLHAASLGHMAMRGHTVKYNNSPLFVVEMNPYYYRPDAALDFGLKEPKVKPLLRDNAAKLASMDFLLNHQDRHAGNLLVDSDKLDKATNLLAIDNGRSLQYTHVNRFREENKKNRDHLFNYWFSPGYKYLLNKNLSGPIEAAAGWWERNAKNIKREFRKQMTTVNDPKVHKHMTRSFKARAEALDNFVNGFKKHGSKPYEQMAKKIYHEVRTKTTLADKRAWAKLRVPILDYVHPAIGMRGEDSW